MRETLAEQTSRRLWQAGIGHDDPGLAYMLAWNAAASDRQLIRVELRRGQFGMTRTVRLDEILGAPR